MFELHVSGTLYHSAPVARRAARTEPFIIENLVTHQAKTIWV